MIVHAANPMNTFKVRVQSGIIQVINKVSVNGKSATSSGWTKKRNLLIYVSLIK